MNMVTRFALVQPIAISFMIALLVSSPVKGQETGGSKPSGTETSALTILVADPLAKELACDCVAGFAQRRYEALALVLEKRLKRPVNSFCAAKLSGSWSDDQPVSLIVGKYSDIIDQAKQLGRKVYPLAALTDTQSATTLQGLFVVRSGNRAKSLQDLRGYRIMFGPVSCEEKHSAAIEALKKAGIQVPTAEKRETALDCTAAANELMKLTDQDDAVAVISDYAKVLLEGCHGIEKDALRVIGKTAPVPFITVFATDEVEPRDRVKIQKELFAARRYRALLRLLESKDGFKAIEPERKGEKLSQGWTDYRGARRAALVPALPDSLDLMRTLWTASLDGRGLGGIAVTDQWVFATDRTEETRTDFLKMFEIRTGTLRFSGDLVEPTAFLASKNLDYGNSIRTTPVVHDGKVYVFDAFGALYVWEIPTSDMFPPTECITGTSTALLTDDFKLATWGLSSTPLFTTSPNGTDRFIINTCSATHTLLALASESLTTQWTGAGQGSGYASCIVGSFGGRRQVVGYDSHTLGGWDVDTGERIWTIRPEVEGDYNVPTPVALDETRLLVVTESNGMRIYQFNGEGIPDGRPIAANEDITNDTVTPVAVAGKAYCTSDGTLYQLDTDNGLQVTWSMGDKCFNEHVSLIADTAGRRLLVITYQGELLLFDISGAQPSLIARRSAFAPHAREEVYSHPAFVGSRLYLRGLRSLTCIAFK